METRKLKDLKFDERNINQGSAYGQSLLEKSLREVGAGRSILLDKNGVILAGNQTIQKAGELGFEEVVIVPSDGRRIIAVQRTDIDINSPQGAKMKILDNSISKHNYIEDAEMAEAICEEYELEGAEMGLDVKKEVQEDDYEIPDEIVTDIKEGDLLEIGPHRLLCGDSMDKNIVTKLLSGKEPYLMVTDPPYGVEYDAEWRGTVNRKDGKSTKVTGILKVNNDTQKDWYESFILSPSKVAYVYHPAWFCSIVQRALEHCNFEIRNQIIWNKNILIISRGHYHWKHEPCWYAVKKGCNAKFTGDRKQSTVWDIQKQQRSETGHSTQKPVDCMYRPIANHEGDVYDPFLGSGSTMVAAHQLGRICYGIEISPQYCQIVVDRMKALDPAIEIKRNGQTLA